MEEGRPRITPGGRREIGLVNSAIARIGRAAGLTAEEVSRVREGPEAPGWSPRRALLLRAVDELHAEGRIGDELWGELAESYEPPLLIEICMLVGHYEMLAMTLSSLRVLPERPPRDRS